MNVISTLEQELKDKNYTDVQIMRYIYIRCCELFHFDKAWYYANYTFDTTSKKELKYRRFLCNMSQYCSYNKGVS